jgi:hypothetical protein
MFHNKGVYALLLGSGVSRSAGIPTGWEITMDLIGQVAALSGEEAGTNPEEWLRASRGMAADYSKLLDELAKTPAQRRAVLAGYIEPSESEREEGLKAPTAAHRAIAELVRRGYIRVIVTTNFDRLLETALKDVGIEPTVLASDDAVIGAVPITHTQCTIVKIHGDYLDTRIRNTDAELASYSPALDKILDKILDEFGLIVCGWSATWDPALSASILRSPSRRYSTYWTLRGKLSAEAQALADQRKAERISIDSADKFFTDLESKVKALEEFSRPHPLSAAMGVAMVKRYIVDDASRIKLSDLIEDTLEDALGRIPADMLSANTWDGPEYLRRTEGYEAALASVMPILATGARWSEPRDQPLWLGAVRRLLAVEGANSGATDAIEFRRYLAVLAYYAVGVGAVSGGRYGLLNRLLTSPFTTGQTKGYLPDWLALYVVASGDMQKLLPGSEKRKTPLSDHLFSLLQRSLPRDVTAADFDQSFDKFEILVALADMHQSFPEELPSKEGLVALAAGRFIWRRSVIKEMTEQLEREGSADWLDAGFFDGSKERALALLKLLHELAVKYGGRF